MTGAEQEKEVRRLIAAGDAAMLAVFVMNHSFDTVQRILAQEILVGKLMSCHQIPEQGEAA